MEKFAYFLVCSCPTIDQESTWNKDLLDKMPCENVGEQTAMIIGYMQHNRAEVHWI